MKKVKLLLSASALTLALFVSCTSAGIVPDSLAGTWFCGLAGTGSKYTFNSDGTYEYDYTFLGLITEWQKGTFDRTATDLTFTPTSQSASTPGTVPQYTLSYTLSGTTLDLIGTSGPGANLVYSWR